MVKGKLKWQNFMKNAEFSGFTRLTPRPARLVYYGLLPSSTGAGIGWYFGKRQRYFSTHRDGLVNDIFTADILSGLGKGSIALGHVRYGTRGTIGIVNAQPVVVDHMKGRMAVAYNGRIVNACELREKFELNGSIFHSTGDAEIIAHLVTSWRIKTDSIEEAVCHAMDELKGAYSMVLMSPSKLIACRDPYGIRPLCIGKTPDGMWIISSESCGIDAVGGTLVRDVLPGEIVVFNKDGVKSITTHCNTIKPALCIFEYIYFARPDSVIDGCSVQQARIKAGEILAEAYPVDADVVVGVPDSGLDAAVGYSRKSGIPRSGVYKNKYIGRT